MVNPAAAFPAGGSTYDGTGYFNSGLSGPSAPPYVLTFTAPGTYEYLCLFHPVPMKGTVTVQEQGAAYPHDQAAYDQMGAEQAARLLDEGRALIAQHEAAATPAPAADGTTVWEVAAGVGGERVEADRFLPGELTISVGDTVRWTNRSQHLPHTVTFLGGEEPPELLLVEPQEGGPPKLALNPVVAEPAGGPTYDGDGFTNSGYLGRELPEFYEEFPRNPTYELTFSTPGQYRYYCVIHAGGPDDSHGMTGTIIVS
jgi:plastocyanin